MTKALFDILNNGADVTALNYMNLVLIPKKRKLTNFLEFQPISLSNVIYKIMSKVLVNRLKPVMPIVISNSQCAFVHCRSIFDKL